MIQLRTFNLQKINEIEHYVLIKSLSRDPGVMKYIAKDFSAWVKKQQSVDDKKIEIGKSYVIEKDGKYVGIIGSLNFSSDGILELWCAIQNNLRGNGYGEKVLAEITPYLIEHVEGLNDINLKIDVKNKGSQIVAERNGYIRSGTLEDFDDVENWYYFGHDYKKNDGNGKKK